MPAPHANSIDAHQRLYVNVDHVATIRQARRADEPDPLAAASLCEQAGADGITAHLREDRRHIQDADIIAIARAVTTVFNLEIANTAPMIDLAVRLLPFQVSLVPEKREEVTTEGGLDVTRDPAALASSIQRLRASGIRVSLFIDPDLRQVDASMQAGAPVIELHTGAYADCAGSGRARELERIRAAAQHASAGGISVNAGHGLNYHNVGPIAAIEPIVELNIGHAIIARAVFDGLEQAVRDMKRLMLAARR